TVRQDTKVVTGKGPIEIGVEPQIVPAAFVLPGNETADGGARDDEQRDPLADVGGITLPSAQQIRAHGTRALALRSEHVAIDDQSLLIAEQPREIGEAVLAFEAVIADHRAAGG